MSGDNVVQQSVPVPGSMDIRQSQAIVKVCFSLFKFIRKRKVKEEQEKGHHDYQTESVLQRVAAASIADIMFIETSVPIVTMVGDR